MRSGWKSIISRSSRKPASWSLWNEETALLEQAAALSLETIALQRINAINAILKQYE